MSSRNPAEAMSLEDAVYHYVLASIAALGLIFLVLLYRGYGWWGFLPVLVGLTGVLLRWRMTPMATLLLLAAALFVHETIQQAGPYSFLVPLRRFSLSDWVLSGAILAYAAAHYRLHGLMRSPFSKERGWDGHTESLSAPEAGTREPRSITPWQVGGLMLTLPVCAFLAQLCWIALPMPVEDGGLSRRAWKGLSSQAWKGILLAWLTMVGLLLAAAVLGYLHQRDMTRQEARLFLQDVFWHETRREQRRLNRWLAWARLRRWRRE
jgi:hypothetical protein